MFSKGLNEMRPLKKGLRQATENRVRRAPKEKIKESRRKLISVFSIRKIVYFVYLGTFFKLLNT